MNNPAYYRDLINRILIENDVEDDIPPPPSKAELRSQQDARRFAELYKSKKMKVEVKNQGIHALFINMTELFTIAGISTFYAIYISYSFVHTGYFEIQLGARNLEDQEASQHLEDRRDEFMDTFSKILAIIGLSALASNLKFEEHGYDNIFLISKITEQAHAQLEEKYGFKRVIGL